MNAKWKKFFDSYYWLLVLLIFLDQLIKGFAIKYQWHVTVIPNFFHIDYVRNMGAGFSILSGNLFFLALLSFTAAGVMLWHRIYRRKEMKTNKKILWAIIIAGTIGNFIDRAFYRLITGEPGVVDYLSFQFGSYFFPTFNLADICLTVGIIAMVILTLVEERQNKVPNVIEGEYKEKIIDDNVNDNDDKTDNKNE